MGEVAAGKVELTEQQKKFLLWTCFVSLVATSVAFVLRAFLAADWQIEFGLSETQKGEILGAGMWPFGLSIVLFSLVIDRIGYGKSMIFAFACHSISVILFFFAGGYWSLYVGSFLAGLAAGTVEAVVNPAIAAVYPKEKAKWLAILHGGWSGGIALMGIALLVLGGVPWRFRVVIILIPVVAYGVMLMKAKFAPSERVSAGIPFKDMLAEAGALSCLIVTYMLFTEIDRLVIAGFGLDWQPALATTFFKLPSIPFTILMVLVTVGYYIYTKSLGRWMYVFLLFVMILLATTELGTDGWIKDLMGPAMSKLGFSGGWVLVYTAVIMTVLRFLAGPIMKGLGKISKVLATPLGFLLLSSVFAATGIYFLAGSRSWFGILFFATIYGIGQCFFWPITIALAAERFPKGGALTINAIAGVGMLGVGIIGMQLLGFWQDRRIDDNLMSRDKVAYERLMQPKERVSVFGNYKALDQGKLNAIGDKLALNGFRENARGDLAVDAPELSTKLAEDAAYQTLTRIAYDRHARSDDKTHTHDEMHAAIVAGGLLVGSDDTAALAADQGLIDEVRTEGKRDAMATVAILPVIMALCYLGLIIYFKKTMGGYKAVDILEAAKGE